MNVAKVKEAIEAAKANYKKAQMKGSIYEMGVIDGLDLALKAVDTCMKQEENSQG